MKKEAEKFIGRIVKITDKRGNYGQKNFKENIDYIAITQNFDEFEEKLKLPLNLYDKNNLNIELYKDNITLYKVDLRYANGKLANLVNIKELWHKGKFDYREFYTKKQIKLLLENDYLIAVCGLQEIGLDDLDKLEDDNAEIDWKLDNNGNFYI